MLTRPQTVDDWMIRLEPKSLKFLSDQMSPCVRGYNGAAYDAAVLALLRKRREHMNEEEAEEELVRHRVSMPREEEEEGEVEIVPYGGKGQTLRIVHPRGRD